MVRISEVQIISKLVNPFLHNDAIWRHQKTIFFLMIIVLSSLAPSPYRPYCQLCCDRESVVFTNDQHDNTVTSEYIYSMCVNCQK